MSMLQEIVPTFVEGTKTPKGQQKIQVPTVDVTQHRPKEVFKKCTRWQIDKSEFNMTSKIGEGAYGMVYKCTVRGEVCAAKMLKQDVVDTRRTTSGKEAQQQCDQNKKMVWRTVDEYKSQVAYKDLVMELDVLVSVGQHPNLVGFKGAYLVDECNPIVFEEFVSGASLKAVFARKAKGGRWRPPKAVAYYWIQDLLRGIEYLHNRDPVIIHRDLKPGNLMLTKDLCCLKIGDFGMCKMVPRGEMRSITHTGHCGTVAYMAPEMYNKAKTHYDEKVDIYSAAVIMWYIATGLGSLLSSPGGAHDVELRPDVTMVGWPQLEEMITRAWQKIPEMRPSASEMLAQLKRFEYRPPPLTPLDFKQAGCSGCAVQ